MITIAEVSPSAVHRPWKVSPEAYLQQTRTGDARKIVSHSPMEVTWSSEILYEYGDKGHEVLLAVGSSPLLLRILQ